MRPRSFACSASFFFKVWMCAVLAVLLIADVALADKSLLVKVKRPDGSESAIYQKVLVTTANANLVKNPGEKGGQPLDPFTIFFRLKADSGQLVGTVGKDSYWRVGDEEGNPAGWIRTTAKFKADDGRVVDGPAVKEWNTRLVLDPQAIASPDKPFNLLDPSSRAIVIPFKGAIDSSQGRALAFVLDEANENDEYPSEFFIGRERTGDEPPDIEDLKLEIAFVLEMTEFMKWEWDGGVTTLDLLRETVADIAKKVESSDKARGRVRFAVVQYQDTMGGVKRGDDVVPQAPEIATPNVALNFVTTAAELSNALSRLQPQEIMGDWPEDGLGGIAKAMSGLSWTKESSKHVILVGQGAMQQKKKGEQVSQYDLEGRSQGFNEFTSVNEKYGWSSTGKDVNDVVEMAKGSGNDLAALMNRVVLHTILLGKPPEEVSPEWAKISAEAIRWPTQEVYQRAENASNVGEFVDAYVAALRYQAEKINRSRAEKDFATLARNGLQGEFLGIFEPAEPTKTGVQQAGDKLSRALEEAFTAFAKSLQNQPAQAEGKIAARVVEIAEAFKKQLQDQESVKVLAAPVNEKGREVAKLKLLVFRTELDRLWSVLDRLYQDFRPLTKRSDRQDASETLNRLKAAVASAAAGQQFTEDTQLATVIGDLPLRTPVLATSAKALAAMSSEDFERWLGQLEFAKKRCRDLLDAGDRWEKHTGGIGSEFSFIEQSQMP